MSIEFRRAELAAEVVSNFGSMLRRLASPYRRIAPEGLLPSQRAGSHSRPEPVGRGRPLTGRSIASIGTLAEAGHGYLRVKEHCLALSTRDQV